MARDEDLDLIVLKLLGENKFTSGEAKRLLGGPKEYVVQVPLKTKEVTQIPVCEENTIQKEIIPEKYLETKIEPKETVKNSKKESKRKIGIRKKLIGLVVGAFITYEAFFWAVLPRTQFKTYTLKPYEEITWTYLREVSRYPLDSTIFKFIRPYYKFRSGLIYNFDKLINNID